MTRATRRRVKPRDEWRPDLTIINRDLMPSAWYRHWMRLQHLRQQEEGVPAEYLETLKEIRPPVMTIRLIERLRLALHRIKAGAG